MTLKTENIKKILIIKISAIGDVLMATPAFHAVRKSFPWSRIYLLVGNWSKEIISSNPHIDEIITIEDEVFFKPWKILSLLRFILRLRRLRFDMIIPLHRSFAFSLFSFLIGAPERVGFDESRRNFFYTKRIATTPSMHEVDKYLQVVKSAGVRVNEIDKRMYIKIEESSFINEILDNYPVSEGDLTICICPGGGINPKTKLPLKNWRIEKYAKLADELIGKFGSRVIVVGSKEEKFLGEELKRLMRHKFINLVGQTSIPDLAYLISRCQLFIGSDSAPMHIADAVGTRTIALFGPTDSRVWGPYNKNNRIIKNELFCSPCYKNDGKPPKCSTKECMESIMVDQVIEVIRSTIKMVPR